VRSVLLPALADYAETVKHLTVTHITFQSAPTWLVATQPPYLYGALQGVKALTQVSGPRSRKKLITQKYAKKGSQPGLKKVIEIV
jgi:hypothetical protein